MPTTRITVALNSKQSQKAPLLLPPTANLEPSASDSCRALVIKAAQSKLRLKKASRIYVAGTGQELLEEGDWRNVLRDDVLLLVSAGEEYVGLRRGEGAGVKSDWTLGGDQPDGRSSQNCSISILAQTASVDPLSLTQVETTAHTLPGIIHAVAQPDLHPGTKFPIGAVFVSKGWIHPPLIGGDIGCGMAWYKSKLFRGQVEGDKGRRVAEKLRGLEGAWRTQEDRIRWLSDDICGQESSLSAGEGWDRSLGTIGAGNHFAEVQVVEAYTSPTLARESGDEGHMLREGDVVLLVHSGSRGYGGDILKRYTAGGKVSIHESDPKAIEYMGEHERACGWAKKNRDLIALRFLACLEPGDDAWELGVNDSSQTSAEAISTAKANLHQRKVVDIWHNNVEKVLWPPKPPRSINSNSNSNDLNLTTSTLNIASNEEQSTVYIHRKGAAPTQNPATSVPLSILPLPGSRGTPTIILHPTFSESTGWGVKNGLSLAHGAGRAMSRAKAATWVAQKYKGRAEDLLRGGDAGKTINAAGNKIPQSSPNGGNVGGEAIHGGTWVVCEEKSLVWEEAPEAYKDVYTVCEDLVREGVAVAVGWCRARVSYKVRNE
ncbi:MAG: hypothetical protein M1830_008195 [Pleopsidium flavum]|nr:MAG: hypothetical protein M1830_008195 [Pleopsidium flavum]